MNFDKYTEKAQSAVVDCQNIAIEEGNQQLEGEHLHLALLKQDQGLIGRLMEYMQMPKQAMINDVQAEIEKVKEALKGTDTDMIKAATEGLSKKFSDLAGKIYQQQAPQGDPNMGGAQGAGAQGGQQGDFVDADFTEVKDDDNK